ncbi:MAG: cobyrinate a,c-diamide synthase [Verrucomicrobia bacterium]|nr:cobyrinate a,c-diamide synthase [Verrucomicrobiota bacterium]
MNIPRLVIAGTQSGVGKTSVTLGLVAALKRRGLRVQTFKVGPDYLDPTYLALASGRPCYNLDGWMTDKEYVCELFARVSADADLAIIEGVMGLFDGADPAALSGSTAEIACWLEAPVLLIANAHGAGRSFAATVHGFATFIPEIRLAGVIANRCGSERHAEGLAASLSSAALPAFLGAVQRGALPELPSRHLGLVSADAKQFSQAILDQLADAVEVALDGILDQARKALPIQAKPTRGMSPNISPATVRLGIAQDEAFHFYYADNLDALRKAGCELVPFSPVRDGALPPDLHGIYIGGGYPEEHAEALAANTGMLDAIREFVATGHIVYAECGGLMYLSQGIETLDNARHRMLGLLPAWTRMCPRRQSLGYMEAEFTRDCFWGEKGERLRGHEFHYSELTHVPEECPKAYALHYRRSDRPLAEGFQCGSVLASYAHLHFAAKPGAVVHFVNCLKTCIP